MWWIGKKEAQFAPSKLGCIVKIGEVVEAQHERFCSSAPPGWIDSATTWPNHVARRLPFTLTAVHSLTTEIIRWYHVCFQSSYERLWMASTHPKMLYMYVPSLRVRNYIPVAHCLRVNAFTAAPIVTRASIRGPLLLDQRISVRARDSDYWLRRLPCMEGQRGRVWEREQGAMRVQQAIPFSRSDHKFAPDLPVSCLSFGTTGTDG